MDKKIDKVIEILKKYNQEHLLRFYDELEEDKKDFLLEQILHTNFEQILHLYKNSFINDKISLDSISPLKHFEKEKFNQNEIKFYTEIGENVIKSNSFAVITMAGGQGTRLRL